MIELMLFVSGNTPRSRQMQQHLQSNFEKTFKDAFILEVIDVLKTPLQAEENGILATPTLLKRNPPPERRILGDMKNPQALFSALDLETMPDDHRPHA